MANRIREYLGVPIPDETPAPVVAEIASNPDEHFAAHVSLVREQGDATDALSIRPDSYLGSPFVYGGSVLFAEAASVATAAPVPALAAGALLASSGYFVARKRSTIAQKKFEQRSYMAETGNVYELYRIGSTEAKDGDVVMRWYGTVAYDQRQEVTESERLDELRKVATMAETNAIKAVLVSDELLPDRMRPAAREGVPEISISAWMKKTKTIDVHYKRDGEQHDPKLFAFSPDQLRSLSYQSETGNGYAHGLENAIDYVRSVNPGHPVVRNHDRYKDTPDQLPSALKRSATRCLERRLDDVVLQKTPIDSLQTVSRTKAKVHLSASITAQKVDWKDNGKIHSSAGLLSSLGMTEQRLHTVISNPADFSTKEVTLALECAAFLNEYQAEKTTDEEVLVRRQGAYPIIQESLKNVSVVEKMFDPAISVVKIETGEQHQIRLRSSSANKRRFVTSCAMLGATACASFIVIGANNEYDTALKTSESSYAADLHVQPDQLSTAQREYADSLVAHSLPPLADYLKAQRALKKQAQQITHDLEPWDSSTKKSTGSLNKGLVTAAGISQDRSATSGVGNSPQDGNVHHSEWQLASTGGMSTAGYWAMDTGITYNDNGSWTAPDVFGSETTAAIPVLPATLTDKSREHVHVSRQLGGNETVDVQVSGGMLKIVRIPVLAGTEPAAVNYDGKQVELAQRDNGTYEVALFEPNGVNQYPDGKLLSYDLVPYKYATEPHAIQANIIASDTITGRDTYTQRIAIRRAMDGAVPGSATSFPSRESGDTQYISNTFTYDFTPLSLDFEKRLHDGKVSPSELVAEELRIKSANCNLAGTDDALNNPELNTAWGWRNNTDGQLQDGEAHMWTVDKAGKIFDATPWKTAPEIRTPESGHDLLLASGIGVGVLTAAGILGAGMYRRRRPRWAQRKLASTAPGELVRAKNVADMAAYAAMFDAARLPADEAADHTTALASLSQHQVHSEHVAQSLEATRRTSTRAERKLLKSASRIIGLVQRAGYAKKVEHADDLLSMLS